MTTLAFRRLLREKVNVKRPPVIVSGQRGPATVVLTGIRAGSFDPVTEENQRKLGLNAPMTLMQTFVEGDYDVRKGDYLTRYRDGKDYQVYAVGDWDEFNGETFRHIFVEKSER